jgi:hypothetical protein
MMAELIRYPELHSGRRAAEMLTMPLWFVILPVMNHYGAPSRFLLIWVMI